jgi:hypothetical protein
VDCFSSPQRREIWIFAANFVWGWLHKDKVWWRFDGCFRADILKFMLESGNIAARLCKSLLAAQVSKEW